MRGIDFGFYLALISYINGVCGFTVTRGKLDRRTKLFACEDPHSDSGWFICTCKVDYNTIMTTEHTEYLCHSPKEIGCYHSLLESKQTYLLTKGSETKVIFPSLYTGNQTIHRIYVWNLIEDTNYGRWHNVTEEVSDFFSIDSNDSLSIINLDMDFWKGHLIKIEFGYEGHVVTDCLTTKVAGKLDYPFDINTFKSNFPKPTVPPRRKSTSIATSTVSPSRKLTSIVASVSSTTKLTSIVTSLSSTSIATSTVSPSKLISIATTTAPSPSKLISIETSTVSSATKFASIVTSVSSASIVTSIVTDTVSPTKIITYIIASMFSASKLTPIVTSSESPTTNLTSIIASMSSASKLTPIVTSSESPTTNLTSIVASMSPTSKLTPIVTSSESPTTNLTSIVASMSLTSELTSIATSTVSPTTRSTSTTTPTTSTETRTNTTQVIGKYSRQHSSKHVIIYTVSACIIGIALLAFVVVILYRRRSCQMSEEKQEQQQQRHVKDNCGDFVNPIYMRDPADVCDTDTPT